MTKVPNVLRCIFLVWLTCVCSLLFSCFAISQTRDTTSSLNLLTAPTSPGFVLLGKEPTSVDRPTSVTDFAVNVLAHTNDLSTFPKDYSVEIAPWWLLFGSGITYEDFIANKPLSNITQTLSLSLASSSDSGITSLAGGVRFSVFQGEVDPAFNDYASKLENLYKELGEINFIVHNERMRKIDDDTVIKQLHTTLMNADSALQIVLAPIIETQIAVREAEIARQVEDSIRTHNRSMIEKIRSAAADLRVHRIGWKLDVAGGIAYDFPGNIFDDGFLKRWGFWLTPGYEGNNFGMLGVLRILSNVKQTDHYSIDIGGRGIYDDTKSFSASFEGVYRKYHNDMNTDHQWRVALIVDYAISPNKVISLTYGRDFEGTRSGNVIAALNLLFGFGSTRPMK
jgi:hypothetical protein